MNNIRVVENEENYEVEQPDLVDCNCCDSLESLTIKIPPKIFLPALGIDFNKGMETIEEYQRLFNETGVRVVVKDLSSYSPGEIQQSIKALKAAEENLYCVNPHGQRPFKEKICILFKFHGKQMTIGRFRRDCPIELKKGDLVVLTSDDRYRLCSFKELIFVNNLVNYPLTEGVLISMEGMDNVILLKVVKILQQNITCCIKLGGKVQSYSVIDANMKIIDSLTYTDIQNCKLAIEHNVQGIILPHVKNSTYYYQIKQILSHENRGSILIFGQIDESDCDYPQKFCPIIETFDGLYFNQEYHSVLTENFLVAARCKNKLVLWTYMDNNLSFTNRNLLLIPDCFILNKQDRKRPDYKTTEKIGSLRMYIEKVHATIYKDCHIVENDLSTVCLISISSSGDTAKELSKIRDKNPIICISDAEEIVRELHLYKNVKPLLYDWTQANSSRSKIIQNILQKVVAWTKHQHLLGSHFCIKKYSLNRLMSSDETKSDGSEY